MSESRCRRCRNVLQQGSIYCTECEEYQNWRRHLSVSNTTLALLIALFSVIGSGYTTWTFLKGTFAAPRDEVVLRLVAVDTEKSTVSLMASNLGNRAAALRGARLVLDSADAATVGPGWDLVLPEDRMVASGQSRQIDLRSPAGKVPRLAGTFDKPGRCRVEVELVHFDGSHSEVVLTYNSAAH